MKFTIGLFRMFRMFLVRVLALVLALALAVQVVHQRVL